MPTNASITVYVQALGGKFLGPNAYEPNSITVILSYSGGEVTMPYQVVEGTTDDGVISQGFSDGSTSFMPILNMPALSGQNPNVFYLTPDTNTIAANGQFTLPTSNEVATLTVGIPSPSGNTLSIVQSVILTPQIVAYHIGVVVPGLLLTLNTANPIANSVSVFATMMCGCKVTEGLPNSFWTPSDFSVNALVQYNDGTATNYPLSLDTQTNNSLFSAAVQNAGNIQSVCFTAQQKSTGNYGTIVQTF